MAIIGKTFNFQSVTAGDDGELYNMLSGRINMAKANTGTMFSIANNVLTTGEISLIVSGRFVRISNGTTISLGTIPSSATKGRVIIRLDMTKLATESSLMQIETEVETTSGSFRTLTQQNINSISGQSNNVYEAVLCTFTCASGTASAPVNALSSPLSYPLSIANGGTGGTSRLTAQRNLMLPATNNTTLIEGTSSQIGAMGFSACFYSKAQYTGSHPEALPTNWGVLVSFCNTYNDEWHQLWLPQGGGDMYRRGGNSSSTPYAVTWTKIPDDVPDIVQFYISKSSYSRFGYANLQITTRTNVSGDTSFTSANTDYWNIQLNPGTYRMNLYCSFQSSSAVTTDVGIGLGNNANRRATPIEARVQTTGSLTKLNASGILKVTSYNDLYSFLIYMGDTTARDIGGYWTIERIGQ